LLLLSTRIGSTYAQALDNQQPPQLDAVEPKPSVEPKKEIDDHRIFGVVPNYKTVNDPSQPVSAISTSQKFELVLHYFDPFTWAFTGVQAGIQQMSNSPKEYKKGMLGYSRRYGADFTDAFTNELFTVGVFPALLREDPRYFRRGSGGGLRRTGYAISRVLVARSDAGAHRPNYSEFLGNFTSGAISSAYYPKSERGFRDIANRAAFQIGYDAMFNIVKEFYPDIKRKLWKKSNNASR
jgi:hypothetical protein